MTTATVDRSEFRHILFSGTIVGLITAAAVIVFLVLSRLLPAGIVMSLLGALVVLETAMVTSVAAQVLMLTLVNGLATAGRFIALRRWVFVP